MPITISMDDATAVAVRQAISDRKNNLYQKLYNSRYPPKPGSDYFKRLRSEIALLGIIADEIRSKLRD